MVVEQLPPVWLDVGAMKICDSCCTSEAFQEKVAWRCLKSFWLFCGFGTEIDMIAYSLG